MYKEIAKDLQSRRGLMVNNKTLDRAIYVFCRVVLFIFGCLVTTFAYHGEAFWVWLVVFILVQSSILSLLNRAYDLIRLVDVWAIEAEMAQIVDNNNAQVFFYMDPFGKLGFTLVPDDLFQEETVEDVVETQVVAKSAPVRRHKIRRFSPVKRRRQDS